MNEASKSQFTKKGLTPKSKNVSAWYNEVIELSRMADYGPVRGTMVIRPYGYSIWENIQQEFNKRIRILGVENAYFPLFIPLSYLEKEKEHLKGFAPELAVVTHGGGKKLAEPLVVRPTSETIMYKMYSQWISSWRDLPLKINQWNNCVRWEKRIYFFLRTMEFLWQEGHTAHATYEEAEKMTRDALESYADLYRKVYAIEPTLGVKSKAETFPGADHTYTCEVLVSGGKVLQAGTSHNLTDNFSKVFDIKFQDKDGNTKYVYQTSWGLSTRSIGVLILSHGDDKGLVLPPKLAPIKVAIIPILGKKDDEVLKYGEKVKKEIEVGGGEFPGRVELWSDAEKSYGWKVNEAELIGIPIRISIGTREVDEKVVTISSRIDGKETKLARVSEVYEKVEEMLKSIQEKLLENSRNYLKENTREVKSYAEFKNLMKTNKGLIRAFWCENSECEAKIKKETKASTRCLPLDAKDEKGSCVYCGKAARHVWYFAQSY